MRRIPGNVLVLMTLFSARVAAQGPTDVLRLGRLYDTLRARLKTDEVVLRLRNKNELLVKIGNWLPANWGDDSTIGAARSIARLVRDQYDRTGRLSLTTVVFAGNDSLLKTTVISLRPSQLSTRDSSKVLLFRSQRGP
jgi:hypothetical protein